MEYMSLSMSPYDIDRFGALLPRFSPRQADLLMVIGTVNHKLSPVLKRVYEQMSEPKWVMAFGACAASGGFYDNYATVQGIDRIIPVDVYVPGCPPRPEALLYGLMRLQDIIMREAPSAYLFESDGSVHRNRQFEDEVEVSPQEAARLASAPLR